MTGSGGFPSVRFHLVAQPFDDLGNCACNWANLAPAYFDKVTLTEMSLCEFAADGHGYRMRTATAKPRAVRTARSCRFA